MGSLKHSKHVSDQERRDVRILKALFVLVLAFALFALCKPVLWSAGKILNGKPSLVSVPVLTSEPGNAGTLIRTSDAMGADALVATAPFYALGGPADVEEHFRILHQELDAPRRASIFQGSLV